MSMPYKRSVVLVVGGIFVLLGLLSISPAHAETAKTTKNTRVMQRPAKRATVITRVGAGKVVKVLRRKGRWIKVRVNGRTGWIARSALTTNARARGSDSRKRKRPFVTGRSKERNFEGSAPSDLVGADSVDPDQLEETDELAETSPDAGDEPEAEPASEGADEDDDSDQADERVAARDEPPKKRHKERERKKQEKQEEDSGTQASELVQLAAATELRRKPSATSKVVMNADAGMKLAVVKRADDWLLVESAAGDKGWIRADDVAETGGPGSYVYPKRLLRASARANAAMIRNQYVFGSQELPAINLNNDTLSLFAGGEVLLRFRRDIMLRGDLSYSGLLGKLIDGTQSPPTSLSYSTHELNLGAAAGYDFHDARGMVVYGRAGIHYAFLRVAPIDNTLSLPSESLFGVTLGSSVDIPRLHDKIGMRASVDVLLPYITRRTQTKQLTDGELSLAWATWLTVLGSYQLQPTLHIEASYRIYRGKTNWVGSSQRFPAANVSSTSRTDINHMLGIGASKLF